MSSDTLSKFFAHPDFDCSRIQKDRKISISTHLQSGQVPHRLRRGAYATLGLLRDRSSENHPGHGHVAAREAQDQHTEVGNQVRLD